MDARQISPPDFIKLSENIPIIDVRSPKEFAQGHIPGARNIPLFSDEERAEVGTTYTHSGNRQAILRGLEMVGPKLKDLVQTTQRVSPGGHLLVHCWRGGMRSEAMAWLFNFSGLSARVLAGGYKAYRKHIREALSTGPGLRVIGGMTGSGKTEILRHLHQSGEQVIDLEALACHKGSAFGALGEQPQPTTEQFENELAGIWMSFDASRPAWIEDESLNIGKVVIPLVFFNRMRDARLYIIEMPFEKRVMRLMDEYGRFDQPILLEMIEKISRRMGAKSAREAAEALMSGDLKKSVEMVLNYYDQSYAYSLKSRELKDVINIRASDFSDFRSMAGHLKTIR